MSSLRSSSQVTSSLLRLIWCLAAAVCLIVAASDTRPSKIDFDMIIVSVLENDTMPWIEKGINVNMDLLGRRNNTAGGNRRPWPGANNSHLVGMWPLTRTTGARDVSPYKRDAKLGEGVIYENGDCGVLQVHKKSGSVTIGQLPDERGLNGSFTAAMWIRLHKPEASLPIVSWNRKDGKTLFNLVFSLGYVIFSVHRTSPNRLLRAFTTDRLKVGHWIKIAVAYESKSQLQCTQADGQSHCWRSEEWVTDVDGGFDVPRNGKVEDGPVFDLFCLQMWRTAPEMVQGHSRIAIPSFDNQSEPCHKWNPNVCMKLNKPDGSNADSSRKPSWKVVAYGFLVAAVIAFVAVALWAILYHDLHNRGVGCIFA